MNQISEMKDVFVKFPNAQSEFIENVKVDKVEMDSGSIEIVVDVQEVYYYEMLSEMTGMQISSEYELIKLMKEMAELKEEYEEVREAISDVKMRGYGVVKPKREEIHLDEPTVIKQGNRYGVKIRSEAPSIHLIRANIETEIAPIVGSEQQANDLVRYIKETEESEAGIWQTNIFGKSIAVFVSDGMRA